MAQQNWTFEGTTTAQLQSIHDGLVSYLSGGEVSKGIGAFVQKSRGVTKISISEARETLSMVSNELARRALPNRDEILDSTFGNGPGRYNGLTWGGSKPW